MNLLEQFARHIEYLGLGAVSDSEVAGDIFWGLMPDQPDACVCVFSSDAGYGGSYDGARLQVTTRAKTTKAASERSQAITEALVDFDGFLAGDGAQVSISVINSCCGIGTDAKKRELYVSNYLVYYCYN